MLAAALRANAAFSTVSALIFIFASSQVAKMVLSSNAFSSTPWSPQLAVQVIGVGLVAFAAYCLWLSFGKPPSTHRALGVVAADLAWVFGSGVALFFFPSLFTTTGVFAVACIAAAVSGFALWQWIGVRQA